MRSSSTVSPRIYPPQAWTHRKPSSSHDSSSRPDSNARRNPTRPTCSQAMRRASDPPQYHDIRACPAVLEPLPPLAALAIFSWIAGPHHVKHYASLSGPPTLRYHRELLLARLYPRVDAFRVLKTTEGIELIPSLLAFCTAMVCFGLHTNSVQYWICRHDRVHSWNASDNLWPFYYPRISSPWHPVHLSFGLLYLLHRHHCCRLCHHWPLGCCRVFCCAPDCLCYSTGVRVFRHQGCVCRSYRYAAPLPRKDFINASICMHLIHP